MVVPITDAACILCGRWFWEVQTMRPSEYVCDRCAAAHKATRHRLIEEPYAVQVKRLLDICGARADFYETHKPVVVVSKYTGPLTEVERARVEACSTERGCRPLTVDYVRS